VQRLARVELSLDKLRGDVDHVAESVEELAGYFRTAAENFNRQFSELARRTGAGRK
jgi:hypothetical protein